MQNSVEHVSYVYKVDLPNYKTYQLKNVSAQYVSLQNLPLHIVSPTKGVSNIIYYLFVYKYFGLG